MLLPSIKSKGSEAYPACFVYMQGIAFNDLSKGIILI